MNSYIIPLNNGPNKKPAPVPASKIPICCCSVSLNLIEVIAYHETVTKLCPIPQINLRNSAKIINADLFVIQYSNPSPDKADADINSPIYIESLLPIG